MECLPSSGDLSSVCSLYRGNVCGELTGFFVDATPSEIVNYNNYLDDVASYILLIGMSVSSTCSTIFFQLLCRMVFPICLAGHNKTVHKQRICKETCIELHENACLNKLNGFIKNSLMVKKYPDIANLPQFIIQKMDSLGLRNNCDSDVIYVSKTSKDNNLPGCYYPSTLHQFHSKTEKSDTCYYGVGDQYLGTINVTVNNSPCLSWSSNCIQSNFIPLGNLTKNSSNFCRNEFGYRQRPWCFINDADQGWEYCGVERCPFYTVWSLWGTCSKCVSIRNRTCHQFGARNCSSLGFAVESKSCCEEYVPGDSNLLVAILGGVIGTILVIVLLLVVLMRRNRRMCFGEKDDEDEIDEIEPTYVSEITPDFISKMTPKTYVPEETDEGRVIDEIYETLNNFRDCLCYNCIKDWLITIVENAPKLQTKTKDAIRLKVCKIVEDLQECQTRLENPAYTCSDKCSYDNAIKQWLHDCVVYSKLNDPQLLSYKKYGVGHVIVNAFDEDGDPLYSKLNLSSQPLDSQVPPKQKENNSIRLQIHEGPSVSKSECKHQKLGSSSSLP